MVFRQSARGFYPKNMKLKVTPLKKDLSGVFHRLSICPHMYAGDYSSSLLFTRPNEWSLSVIGRPTYVSDEWSECVIILPGSGLSGRMAASLSAGEGVEVLFAEIFLRSSNEAIFSPPHKLYADTD